MRMMINLICESGLRNELWRTMNRLIRAPVLFFYFSSCRNVSALSRHVVAGSRQSSERLLVTMSNVMRMNGRSLTYFWKREIFLFDIKRCSRRILLSW